MYAQSGRMFCTRFARAGLSRRHVRDRRTGICQATVLSGRQTTHKNQRQRGPRPSVGQTAWARLSRGHVYRGRQGGVRPWPCLLRCALWENWVPSSVCSWCRSCRPTSGCGHPRRGYGRGRLRHWHGGDTAPAGAGREVARRRGRRLPPPCTAPALDVSPASTDHSWRQRKVSQKVGCDGGTCAAASGNDHLRPSLPRWDRHVEQVRRYVCDAKCRCAA